MRAAALSDYAPEWNEKTSATVKKARKAEDNHRHRRINAAQNLALTCKALLAIVPFDKNSAL